MPALTFDKCCLCIDLRVGCFIIGYLNLIGTIGLTVVSILALAGGAVLATQKHDSSSTSPFNGEITEAQAGTLVMVVAGILLVFVLVALAFAIVLLVGLHKNKPGHLKAYLIYSVVFLVFYILQLIIKSINGGPGVTAGYIIQEILTILLSIYFLLVIRSMFFQMKDPSRGPAIYSAA